MSDRVVARLRYPMPVTGLAKAVKAMEKLYGKGLVIVFDGEDFQEGWMTITRPTPLEVGQSEFKP